MSASKDPLLSRREFISGAVKLAVAGALVPAGASMVLPAITPDSLGGGGPGPVVLRDKQTNAKIPVTLDMLAGEPPVVITAEYAFLPAVVYKVKRSILEASSKKHGYNTAQHALQHPTEPEHAILVYDGKCKHLGCTIGFDKALGSAKAPNEDYDEDGVKDGGILCPCHQGRYDIYDLALNVPGTPPPAPLNVIRFNIGTAEIDGKSTPNAILGVEKIVQDAHRDADLQGDGAPFSLAEEVA